MSLWGGMKYVDLKGLTSEQVQVKAKAASAGDLDQAYADAHAAGDINVRTWLAWVIVDRQANAFGFADSVMSWLDGSSAYPQYNAIQAVLGRMSITQAATSSVTENAAKVGNAIVSGTKWVSATAIVLGLVYLAYTVSKAK